MNNKMIKGSIAGATGIVLLMGGFGTYALWSETLTGINGGEINSGQLDIESAGPTTWSDISGTTAEAIDDINKFVMVPGDTVELRQPLQVDASGTNLKAKLVISGVSSTFGELVVTGTYGTSEAAAWDEASGTYTVTYDEPSEITALNDASEAVVTFALAGDTVELQEDQNKAIELNGVTVTLQQIR